MKEEKEIILKVENLSKQYRLGLVGTGTISHDLNRWWYKIRGKEDPYLKIGDSNDRSTKGNSSYVWALKDVNFEVKRGEVLGIIGKNGAGKSTLLKILSRVTSPSTGSIKSRGRIASLLEVGTGFHPELTGRENIYLNGAILGMTKKEIASKIDEIIEFSGCERYVDTPVKRYSSGMTVRLAFAVAAHLEPDILIVDEVLAVGDAEFQKKAIGKMQDISSEQGRTVLFVSHNLAAVQSLCSRGILLEDGKVVFEGDIDSIVKTYLSSGNNERHVKLSEVKDRIGNGALKFEHIELLDKEGNNISEILSGDFCRFRIYLKYFDQVDLKDCCIGLVIYDDKDIKIADFYSDEMGVSFSQNYTSIDLKIESLMLRGGSYKVILVVQSKTVGMLRYDRIENAIGFKVLTSDFYNSGKLIRSTNV
ncbi:MAG: ABC transporter ATP-binding protein, partial [Nonlabens sp.]